MYYNEPTSVINHVLIRRDSEWCLLIMTTLLLLLLLLLFTRLSDLHWAINTHASRHPSLSTPTSEDEASLAQGVWPVGSGDLRGGKKGDIFRLVRELALQFCKRLTTVCREWCCCVWL